MLRLALDLDTVEPGFDAVFMVVVHCWVSPIGLTGEAGIGLDGDCLMDLGFICSYD